MLIHGHYQDFSTQISWCQIWNTLLVMKIGKFKSGVIRIPDSKVHGANMGPTWVLSSPDGPHVDPMNLAIRDGFDGRASKIFVKSRMIIRSGLFRNIMLFRTTRYHFLPINESVTSIFLQNCRYKWSWPHEIHTYLAFNMNWDQNPLGTQGCHKATIGYCW